MTEGELGSTQLRVVEVDAMRVLRWSVASGGTLVAFVLSWWLLNRLAGDPLGIEIAVWATLTAGIVAAPLTWWAGQEWPKVGATGADPGQVSEQFARALEQLGSDKLNVRVSGVYSLKRVMGDSPAHHDDVTDALSAFIRRRVPKVGTIHLSGM